MNEKRIGWLRLDKKSIKYYVQGAVVVVALMWTWGYVSTMNSDAFAFAQQYVRSNPKTLEAFGPIKSTRLGFFNFKMSYAFGVWTARFQVVTVGEKKNGWKKI
jgi:hypothetical protein